MKKQYSITTQKELRRRFWEENPEWKEEYFTTRKRQNDYHADIRMAWNEFTRRMERHGQISEALLYRATL